MRCIGKDESGATAVEFALISSLILTPLGLGMVDVGFAAYTQLQLESAAEAGLHWARTSSEEDSEALVRAVEAAVDPIGAPIQVQQPEYLFGCAAGGVLTFTTAAPGATRPDCAGGGERAGRYVRVTVSVDYQPIVSLLGTRTFTVTKEAPWIRDNDT